MLSDGKAVPDDTPCLEATSGNRDHQTPHSPKLSINPAMESSA